jgi:hypothetical protein
VSEWTEIAALPSRRHDHDAFCHAGRVHVVGGLDADTAFAPTPVYEGGTWTETAAPMPTPRGLFGGCRGADAYYAVGGQTAVDGEYEPVAAVGRYDPAADAWTSLPALPAPWTGTSAAALPAQADDPRLYAVGRLSDGAPTAEVARYDPGDGSWAEGPSLPGPRWAPAAATLDGTVVAAGGFGADRVLDATLALEDGRWVDRTPMPDPRAAFGHAVDGDHLYVVGGLTADRAHTDAVARYDGRTDRWRTLPSLPRTLGWTATTVCDGTLYAVGGATRTDDGPRFENCAYALDL